jgi:hypothetical protein
VTVTFSRDPSDTSHSKVNVYVKGYQGNKSPVQVASGSESPVTFVINNTGEAISILVQAQGNSGEAPLATAPSTGAQLAKSTAGGYGTNTVTIIDNAQPPIEVEYFMGPGLDAVGNSYPCLNTKNINHNTANVVACYRFTLKQNITVSKVTWNVAAGNAAGRHVAFGIYSADGNTKLVDSGAMSAAALGVITAAVSPVTLEAGTVYWFVQTSDSIAVTGPAIDEAATTTALLAALSNSYARYGTAANASVAGVLPTTLGTITAVVTTTAVCGIALALFEA